VGRREKFIGGRGDFDEEKNESDEKETQLEEGGIFQWKRKVCWKNRMDQRKRRDRGKKKKLIGGRGEYDKE
jgi:hypothetical protein